MSSREFSVRVSEELAPWVRQCGPAKEVIGRIATAARRGLIDADGRDPGPGPERLTVRVPNHALPVIRKLTGFRFGFGDVLRAGFFGMARVWHGPGSAARQKKFKLGHYPLSG
jgi:hypothetical protein